tara:strand:- start:934 stop:1731 length:798 start_codon:yes stop_codon:yes gene_type:complete
MAWKITQLQKTLPKLNNPVLIEGLPGIGNVGKITVDFIKEETKAKPLYDLFSNSFPHSVFVNDNNIVELPTIEIYYTKFNNKNKRDLILLSGDVQPIDEESSYDFCAEVLKICEKLKCKEIVTLGGIGLQAAPDVPKIYCTSNGKEIAKRYIKGTKISNELYGVVGPIVGVTGLLVGLSKKKNIEAISLLAETFAHPMFLGIRGAKEILKSIKKTLNINLNMNKLEKEIEKLEKDKVKKIEDLSNVSKENAINKLNRKVSTDYIG